jgi:hypothetical protein
MCKNCLEKLDEPKMLPCGRTVCSLCASRIKINGNEFDCLLCRYKHEMPKNGLPNNETLLEMLSVKPTSISRGKAYDLLKKSLNNIQKKKSQFKRGVENSTDLINDHCIELRSDVQLATEEIMLQVNDFSSKIIKEIDDYEKELIEFNKTNSVSLDEFNEIIKELESFHTINIKYLKQYKIDDHLLDKSNEEASNLIKKAELEFKKLKNVIFDGKILKFEKNSCKIDESILGVMIDSRIHSNILVGINQFKRLISLCEFPIDQKWTLIYRASQDGFEASSFHAKCDDQPNTFIIIKSTNGNVFGGYTEQSWSGSGYKADPNAFLFSLINQDSEPLKMKCISSDEAIYCSTKYGPNFGNMDIKISSESNENTQSCSNIGYSYEHPDYNYDSNEAQLFLAGSNEFQVLEIEVYTRE